MSYEVFELVMSRKIGDPGEKAIALIMAGHANPDGGNIYCSKDTIALEAEVSRATAFRKIASLETRGLVDRAGSRKCGSGATVIYRLNLEAISRLPLSVSSRDSGENERDKGSHGETPSQVKESHAETPLNGKGSHTATQGVSHSDPNRSMNRSLDDDDSIAREAANDVIPDSDHIRRLCGAMGLPDHKPKSKEIAAVRKWTIKLGLSVDEQEREVRRVAAKAPQRIGSLSYFDGPMNDLSNWKYQTAGPAGSFPRENGVSANEKLEPHQVQYEVFSPLQPGSGVSPRTGRGRGKSKLRSALDRLAAGYQN